MLDIDIIINKSHKIKIFGELINVNQPSVKMLQDFNASMSADDGVDIFDAQQDFVLKILNNNTSARVFKKSEIESLPSSALNAVIDEISRGVKAADNDPN